MAGILSQRGLSAQRQATTDFALERLAQGGLRPRAQPAFPGLGRFPGLICPIASATTQRKLPFP